MKRRIRQLAGVLARLVVTLAAAGAAGAVTVYLVGPGPINCAPHNSVTGVPEPIPRWIIAAGAPALIAFVVGAYYGLGAEGGRWRFLGLVFAAAVAAATFYGVFLYLPANCRPA
ncbi:MAG: hypothetical protein E6I94_09550 [Chloroflexi bacterium]|nr:MAG: hypothetical protein E6I94_09550 [Chloroflexota bacterium]